jgi:hypothetical protein
MNKKINDTPWWNDIYSWSDNAIYVFLSRDDRNGDYADMPHRVGVEHVYAVLLSDDDEWLPMVVEEYINIVAPTMPGWYAADMKTVAKVCGTPEQVRTWALVLDTIRHFSASDLQRAIDKTIRHYDKTCPDDFVFNIGHSGFGNVADAIVQCAMEQGFKNATEGDQL